MTKVKDVRQSGCVLQDTEPPESSAILRKGTKVLGPIRRVRSTRAALRLAHTRENKGPSPCKIHVKIPHRRSPYAVKFEDRSHEVTERQERCAREDAWRLAILKLKETDKATFFSLTNEWSLPAPSAIKLEEREFVVDSGASLHMFSRKDLNSAELETVTVPKSPTTVAAANGEVQTREDATVCVKELDLFVTVMLLEDPQAVLSLGKLCENHGYAYHWTSGQKQHPTKKGRKMECNTANLVPFVVPGLSTSPTSSSHTSLASSSQKTVTPTEHPVSTGSESISEELRQNSSHGLPAWLEEFKDNLVDEIVPEHRDASSSSHELLSEPRAIRGIGQAQCSYSFPEGPKFPHLLANHNYNGSLQKTHWHSRAKIGKFW